MDFFDKLASKLTQLVNDAAAGTEKMAHDAQHKIKISELKSSIKDLYSKIGKLAFESYEKDGKIIVEGELKEAIDCMKQTVDQLEKNKAALEAIKKEEEEEREEKKKQLEQKAQDLKDDVKDVTNKVKEDVDNTVQKAKETAKDVEKKIEDKVEDIKTGKKD